MTTGLVNAKALLWAVTALDPVPEHLVRYIHLDEQLSCKITVLHCVIGSFVSSNASNSSLQILNYVVT